jgi:hypothetical protein
MTCVCRYDQAQAALAGVLGIVILALFLILHPPGRYPDAIPGAGIYLAIAIVCFIAVWCLKAPVGESRYEFDRRMTSRCCGRPRVATQAP